MFGSHCDENNYIHCTLGSVMHLFKKCIYIYIIAMSREIENKQMIYVGKKLFKLMA